MKNSAGTTQTANIYGTTDEVGTNYMCATVDGTNGYIPLYATTDARATSGRVTKGSTTYAIASTAKPAYTKWGKSSGSGNFTVPAGVYKLRVTCVGGGAGGAIIAAQSISNGSTVSNSATGAAGGKTTFGSVSAKGGEASTITKTHSCGSWDSEYGYCSGSEAYATSTSLGKGTTAAVNVTNNTDTVAGTPVAITDYQGNVLFNSHGKGGDVNAFSRIAGAVSNKGACGAVVGASGYKTVKTISVTPGQVIDWSVGAGGAGARNYVNNNATAVTSWWTGNDGGVGPGTGGAIVVEYGVGIE